MDVIVFLHHVNQMAFTPTSGPTNGRLENLVKGVETMEKT